MKPYKNNLSFLSHATFKNVFKATVVTAEFLLMTSPNFVLLIFSSMSDYYSINQLN